MAVNKVVLGEDTLIDLTADTVSADKLAKGTTAHNMAGEPIVGTMEATGGKEYTFTNGLTETDGTVSWDLNDEITLTKESFSSNITIGNSTADVLGVAGSFSAGESNARGQGAISCGQQCSATRAGSASFGSSSQATGYYSFAQGINSLANSNYQMAIGGNNISDSSSVYGFIMGNGAPDSSRSNATAIDWQGNQYLSGDIYTNCTDYTTTSTGLNTPRCGGNKVLTNAIFSLNGTELTITTE